MEAVSVNQFRSNLKECIDGVIDTHDTLRVTRRNAEDFVVMSAEDWGIMSSNAVGWIYI